MHTYLIAIIQGNRFERHSYLLSMHVWWSQMLWLRRNVRVVSHGRRCAKWSCWIRKMMMRMLRKSSSCLLLFTHESRPWATRILISKHVHVFYLFMYFWETSTSAHHIKSISSDRSPEEQTVTTLIITNPTGKASFILLITTCGEIPSSYRVSNSINVILRFWGTAGERHETPCLRSWLTLCLSLAC